MIGNVPVLALIRKSLENNSYPQLSLLSGVCGTGKSTMAETIGLALVCDKPKQGLACGKCKTCLQNIEALATGGSAKTTTFQKFNMARVSAEGGVRKFVYDTFDLSHTSGRLVRILEEFHQVKPDEQRIFLEETARLTKTVFLILVASEESMVDKAVRSRCTKFRMSTLRYDEAVVLMDEVAGGRKLPEDVLRIIHRECSGVPRDMIEQVKFFVNSGASDKEIQDYVAPARNTVFDKLFECAGNFSQYINIVEKEILSQFDNPIPLLRQYLTSIAITLELQSDAPQSGFDLVTVNNLFKLLDSVAEDASLLEIFIRMRWQVAHVFRSVNIQQSKQQKPVSNTLSNGPKAKVELKPR